MNPQPQTPSPFRVPVHPGRFDGSRSMFGDGLSRLKG